MPSRPHLLSSRILACIAGLLLLLAVPVRAAEDFLPPEQAFRLEVEQAGPQEVRLRWAIAPGYYLYRDRMGAQASPSGARLAVELPPGVAKEDPNFGTMQVYHDAASMRLAPAGAAAIDVTWQGCAEAGLCYPPQTQTIRVAAAGAAPAAQAAAPDAAASAAQAAAPAAAPAVSELLNGAAGSDRRITRLLAERSLGWTLPLFFLLGIALAFTPCVLPMLPIVSSVVVGSRAPPRRALALSTAFALPMALTYAALGVAAALAGANLQAMLQNRWTLLGLGGVYVVLALGMFGVFSLQLPAGLRARLDDASRRQRGGTLAGAAAMGVLSALLVGPCMTAPLAGALLYIAQSGKVADGGLLLFALGLGTGAPLVLAATLGARVLPRPGLWMERVKAVLGFLLLGTAVWTLERIAPEPLALLLWGALALAAALSLAHAASHRIAQGAALPPASRIAVRTLAVVAGLWGGAMVLGAAGGAADVWRPLAASLAAPATAAPRAALRFEPVASEQELQARLRDARERGRPVLLDFYADWCVSCKSIDAEVFGDAAVQRALAGVVLLRADVTADDARQRELMRAHQVVGPPTALWFDAAGRERREDRLVGEFTARQLLQHVEAAPGS